MQLPATQPGKQGSATHITLETEPCKALRKCSQLRLENVAYWRSTMAGNVLRSDIQEALLHKNFKHG